MAQANTIWAGDMTYIPTGEGWLYLAVVLDLFSRRIVGWSMGSTTRPRSLTAKVQPQPDESPKPVRL